MITIHANHGSFMDPNLHIIGQRNVVRGAGCRISGNYNRVYGANCTVVGDANIVDGIFSRVIGNANVLAGRDSVATGNRNKLSGRRCTARGDENKLTGNNSHAFGNGNTLTGRDCYAEGRFNTITRQNRTYSTTTPTTLSEPELIESSFSTSSDINDQDIASVRMEVFAEILQQDSIEETTTTTITATTATTREPTRNGGELDYHHRLDTAMDSDAMIALILAADEGEMAAAQTNAADAASTRAVVPSRPVVSSTTAHRTTHGGSSSPRRRYVDCPNKAEEMHDRVAAPESGESVCVVCQVNVPICIALPCRHMAYCVACARGLCLNPSTLCARRRGQVVCSKCRRSVKEISRVFFE